MDRLVTPEKAAKIMRVSAYSFNKFLHSHKEIAVGEMINLGLLDKAITKEAIVHMEKRGNKL